MTTASADRRDTGISQYVERLLQASHSEVEHVVVGQGADVDVSSSQTGNVLRIHPVVHSLARLVVVTSGDARLEVHEP